MIALSIEAKAPRAVNGDIHTGSPIRALICLRMGSKRTMGNKRDAYKQNAMLHSPSAARLSMSKKNRMRDSRAPASAVDTPLSSWRNVMWSLPSLQRCNVHDERLRRTQTVGAVGERTGT